jgi:pimeloyl-ACP methyl ester carboxylesterase
VKYVELTNSGHYLLFDQPAIVNSLLRDWIAEFKIDQEEVVLSEE